LKGHEEIFGFEINSALSALIGMIWFWDIQGSALDAPSTNVVEAPARMFVIQRIVLVQENH